MRVILVPVADRPECGRALKTAFEIGRKLDASVRGCHMRPHRYSLTSVSPDVAEAAWLKKSTKKAGIAARELFRTTAEENGYEVIRRSRQAPGALWSELVGSPEKLMGIVGPVADLIVVSRPETAGGVADLFLTSAVMESSRPVLVLPQTGRVNVGKRVVIAWNQSREAMGAVVAALPLLMQAESVTIACSGDDDRAAPKVSHLANYLVHWGIGSSRVDKRGRDVNQELLDVCREVGADLLIAGAYSRSRWRERVFGGTTWYLTHKARLPVLLFHP